MKAKGTTAAKRQNLKLRRYFRRKMNAVSFRGHVLAVERIAKNSRGTGRGR